MDQVGIHRLENPNQVFHDLDIHSIAFPGVELTGVHVGHGCRVDQEIRFDRPKQPLQFYLLAEVYTIIGITTFRMQPILPSGKPEYFVVFFADKQFDHLLPQQTIASGHNYLFSFHSSLRNLLEKLIEFSDLLRSSNDNQLGLGNQYCAGIRVDDIIFVGGLETYDGTTRSFAQVQVKY